MEENNSMITKDARDDGGDECRIRVEEAIARLRRGEMVILCDDVTREDEGDVVFLADRAEKRAVDFVVRHACGLLCVAVDEEIADRLELYPMVQRNTSAHHTAFTVSVDAANGGTGISVADRWEAVRRLGAPTTATDELVRPGHVFPLVARSGGIFERSGHTEGAVELARLCGASPAAAICEVVGEGDTMARGGELIAFARRHRLGIVTIEELKVYCTRATATGTLPTAWGPAVIETCRAEGGRGEPTVVVRYREPQGDREVNGERHDRSDAPPMGYTAVRIHSECFTGDVLGSTRCDCRAQLAAAQRYLARYGGLLIYLRQEGRGIGLEEKVRAYALQDEGLDTVDANTALGHEPDERDYSHARRILHRRGIERVALLTNNPEKVSALADNGCDVVRIPLEVAHTAENARYLETKRTRFGHLLTALPTTNAT